MASNGGILYHEFQESKLCSLHCVNAVLQGPYFSELDFAALASDLDRTKHQMPLQGGDTSANFLVEESNNVSLSGDFSIQVLEKALRVWNLEVIPTGPVQINPELEKAFICHLQKHCFCIRDVNGEWYNFNSLSAAPKHLSKFYLLAYLDSLKASGWSIFMVRGNFPSEFPILQAEYSNAYGLWLLPEDAKSIANSSSATNVPTEVCKATLQNEDAEIRLDTESENLEAAIAESMIDPASPEKDAAIQIERQVRRTMHDTETSGLSSF